MPNNAIDALNSAAVVAGGSGAAVDDIARAVGIESINAFDDKVKQYYKTVHMQNIEMQNLNKCMEVAQANTDGTHRVDTGIHLTNPDTGEPMYVVLSTYLQEQGVSLPADSLATARDRNFNKDQWQSVLANIKTASDSLSSTNQVDMMKLQSVLNKENQMSSMTSDIGSKENSASMGIIGNMGR